MLRAQGVRVSIDDFNPIEFFAKRRQQGCISLLHFPLGYRFLLAELISRWKACNVISRPVRCKLIDKDRPHPGYKDGTASGFAGPFCQVLDLGDELSGLGLVDRDGVFSLAFCGLDVVYVLSFKPDRGAACPG
jgi:hypothetical protein